jgi:dTDP-glucose 4,6-dehydratase
MKNKYRKILVTGGAGFIGSEFVRQSVKKGYAVTVVDKLTYAGDLARLNEVKGKFKFYKADIADKSKIHAILKNVRPDGIAHFAAETHVDRSIHQSAIPFIQTNAIGTQNLIDSARELKIKRFIHISTDEVYGEIKKGCFYEHSHIKPQNPYSASKAASDHLVIAAINTYQFPAIIIRASNNYGPWQYPEKLVPVVILKALHNIKVPVYGKGHQIREWLHVSDSAAAIEMVLRKGKTGEVYNVGSNMERRNIETVKNLLKLLNKPQTLIQYVKDRPGHDFRYSLSCQKVRRLGWRPKMTVAKGMKQTVEWNLEHRSWLETKRKVLESYWKRVYQS